MSDRDSMPQTKTSDPETSTLSSPRGSSQIFRILELLELGTQIVRSADRWDELRSLFFALKDEAMGLLHRLLKDSGSVVSYQLVPYLRRCAECKRRADDLQAADPSRSWAYHLNLLPACPRDEEILDRSAVSMTVVWHDRRFNLHAPVKEALKWKLAVAKLDRKVWIPDSDFSEVQINSSSSASLQAVVDELRATLDQLAELDSRRHTRMCSVFLSAASADYPSAKQIYAFLTTNGKATFLAPVSLPQLGESDYRRAIEQEIDGTDHMVVVVSNGRNARCQWVEYEWGLFLNEKLAGRKSGNLLTVAAAPFDRLDLPIALRTREVVSLTEDGLERLLGYVK